MEWRYKVLTIEEYIAKRKREDKLNEFDMNDKNENLRLCVNYVFEFFNNYLDIDEVDEQTALKNEKLSKYRNQFEEYDEEVIKWLVDIYSEHGKQINRKIINILKEDEFFFLYDSDKDFRSVSYDCYSKLIKKNSYLKDQTEMLFLFIKDYHRVIGQKRMEQDKVFICEGINEWIQNTWIKYQVNLLEFVKRWINYFYDNEDIWPRTHKLKSQSSYIEYDYDIRQKSNLFNLDSLYRKMPKKAFIKGRKQELEVLMMYYWINTIVGDEDEYWEEYLEKVIPFLK